MPNRSGAVPEKKARDAARSREKILSVAEKLFAEHGFDGVSLGQIASAAGLSRGAPSYFFGSKIGLYQGVLERVFRDREDAAQRACRPLVTWAATDPAPSLRDALAEAVTGYVDFLLRRPTFLKLILREELAGATRLRDVHRESKAIEEAFVAVRSVGGKRGLRPFDVQDAVFLFVSLTFFPLAHGRTFMASLSRDLTDPTIRASQCELAVEQLLRLIQPDRD